MLTLFNIRFRIGKITDGLLFFENGLLRSPFPSGMSTRRSLFLDLRSRWVEQACCSSSKTNVTFQECYGVLKIKYLSICRETFTSWISETHSEIVLCLTLILFVSDCRCPPSPTWNEFPWFRVCRIRRTKWTPGSLGQEWSGENSVNSTSRATESLLVCPVTYCFSVTLFIVPGIFGWLKIFTLL